MRVLAAGACLRPDWTGGEPRVARAIISGLSSRGFEVATDSGERSLIEYASMALSPLDWDAASVARFRRTLQRLRPDVVLGFYNYDDSLVHACRTLRVPCVVSIHIYWPVCPVGTLYIDGSGVCSGPRLSKCLRHMSAEVPPLRLPVSLRFLPAPLGAQAFVKTRSRQDELLTASAIVVPGEWLKRVLMYGGYTNVHSVPNGEALSSYQTRDWSGGTKTVLFASGSTSERKGFRDYLAAAEALSCRPDGVRFVATSHGGNAWVAGLGRVSHEDVLQAISDAYAVVAPALWDEPFSVSVLEAMSSGKPVIAYDVGGMRELLGSAGILVERGNREALVRAIATLLDDPARAISLGHAARQRAEERFGEARMVDEYARILEEVVESGKAAT